LYLYVFSCYGPSSCFLFSNCDGVKPHFVIEGLNAKNMEDFSEREVQPNETVHWSSYFIRILFDQRFIASIHNPMGASVLALEDCLPSGYDGTKIGLDTLYVMTNEDYNATFQKGDTVNSIIHVGGIYRDLEALDNFMQQSKDKIEGPGIDIQLKEPPTNQHTICRFRFSMILKDGSKFETTASEVTLTW
jgi:hypothetical protein